MFELIINLSNKIWKNRVYRLLFFLLPTILTILMMGYYFGTFDQAIHIPFLKKIVDPSLFPNDSFFDLRRYHYSIFWYLLIPFYKLGILEPSMFVLHFISIYLSFWAIWNLSKTLFKNPLTSFITMFVFIIPHIGFSGLPLFEFSLLNRTFALPFLIFAIDLYLKKKHFAAFLITGLMYNIHVISANFVIAMFLFDQIIRIKHYGLFNFLKKAAVFVVAASPVVIWKLSNSIIDTGFNHQWFKIIDSAILSHIFNILSTQPLLIIINLGGLVALIMFFLINKKGEKYYSGTVWNFAVVSSMVLLAQIICYLFLPLTIAIQSQISRIGVFITFFSYLFFVHFLTDKIKNLPKNQILFLFIGVIFSITPLVLPLIWIFSKKNFSRYSVYLLVLVFATFFSILYLSLKLDAWRPGIHIYPIADENFKLQTWAKNNSPKDSKFITPPHLWWIYNLEWRVISERSTVTTLSELLEAAFFPSYISYWQERFNDVAPGALEKFKGNVFDNFIFTKNSYYSLTPEQIESIGKKYQADYIVVEKPHQYNFEIVYQNSRFIVYRIN